MQFFSVCFIKSLTDKRSVKFQLPWRGSTNFSFVSGETERLCTIQALTETQFTRVRMNIYLCNPPLTHRGVTVQILLRHFIAYTNPCKFCQCQYWIFFNERRVVPGFYLSNCAKTCNRVQVFYTSQRKRETVTVSRRHHLFPREVKFEKRLQKFHGDKCYHPDLRSASDWLKKISLAALPIRILPICGQNTSSEWTFCARLTDIISRENYPKLNDVNYFIFWFLYVHPHLFHDNSR